MHTGSTPARKPLTVLALVGAVLALLLGGAARPRTHRSQRIRSRGRSRPRHTAPPGHAHVHRVGELPRRRTQGAVTGERTREPPPCTACRRQGEHSPGGAVRQVAPGHLHGGLAGRLRRQPPDLGRVHLLHRQALRDCRRGGDGLTGRLGSRPPLRLLPLRRLQRPRPPRGCGRVHPRVLARGS